jgi:regulator of replication initiation timing
MAQQTALRETTRKMILKSCCIILVAMSGTVSGWSQQDPGPSTSNSAQPDAMTAAVKELQQQVSELKSAVAEVRIEAAQYRAETRELRQELEMARTKDATPAGPIVENSIASAVSPSAAATDTSSSNAESLQQRVTALEETSELLNGKVNEQDQVKIASGSKYRVRLSGVVLMNLFSNRGGVDNQDVPSYAAPTASYGSDNTFGATLRQSEFGLEVFGPDVAGAKISGNIQADFSGGFPNTLDGVNYGLVRLRTASMRMDWKDTSIIAGQDDLFFSPLSPTSFASLAIPAFGYAGNLWGWIPQVRAEHKFYFSDNQNVTVQAGILDNVTGEPPYSEFIRYAQAGENSGQPAYATRVAWSGTVRDQPFTFGVAGYYSPQEWGFNRKVDGWAGLVDYSIPIASTLNLSGEFYRGRAIGALGGGVGQSVLFSGDPTDPATQVRGLNSIGGWSQLKFMPASKLEFNGAFGLDNPLARDFNAFPGDLSFYGAPLKQNRSALVNVIFRPRSNLLLSAEYRHLQTQPSSGTSDAAEQFNLVMGVLF